MDLSGLIFVALAVAWAAYLIPKALHHHDEAKRSRSVERFSARMRVLARRETSSGRDARLVVTPSRAAAPPVVTSKNVPRAEAAAASSSSSSSSSSAAPTAEAARPADRADVRRAAIAKATRRRRNVLAALLLANVAVVSLAAFHVLAWPWVAAPVGLLAAWLVACRVMVRSERGLARPHLRLPKMPDIARRAVAEAKAEDEALAAQADDHDPLEDTASHPAVSAELRDPDMWDPLPMQLPSYVSKDAAPRTVRTIDLDSTGVWSSGRSEADSALAREAEATERADRERRDGDDHRAVGS